MLTYDAVSIESQLCLSSPVSLGTTELMHVMQRTFQSYKGEPQSWPVSEKASGGTPLTMMGCPSAPSSNRFWYAQTSALWPPT